MIMLNITHPPAGGNPIIVIMGGVSPDYIINPIISGTIIAVSYTHLTLPTNREV